MTTAQPEQSEGTAPPAVGSPHDRLVRLLPCPMCGAERGYTLAQGSTHRWLRVSCAACGRDIGECRADPTHPYSATLPLRWRLADDEWNDAAAHAQALRVEVATLRFELGRAERMRQAGYTRRPTLREMPSDK